MKTIIITGASSGIGYATAKLLATKGNKLILVARSEEKLAKEINASCYKCDLSQIKDVEEVGNKIIREHKNIDVLINNAGVGFPTDLAELGEKEYDKIMNTNFKGLVFFTKKILKIFIKQNKGHIINISSLAGIQANPVAPIYCSSKFALEGYTEGLRMQLKEKKLSIRVSLVRPGGVDTNYWGSRGVDRSKFMTPEEMAKVIEFVVEYPETSNVRYITMESFREYI